MEEEKDPIPLHALIEDSNSMNETLSEQLFKCQDLIGDQISDNLSPNKTEDSSFVNTLHLNHDSSENSAKFCVDQTAMPIIPETEQVPELKNLGVCAYDQTQFEMNIMDQVDKALKQEEEKLRKADLEKEVKSVSDDIRLVHQRLSHLEKALLLAPKEENLMTSAAKREVITIKKEQENKLKHLKKLEAKQKMLNACLSGTTDIANSNFSNNDADDSDLDEETLCHLNNVFTPKETEEERLIRTGEMTPFGTRVFNKAKAKKIMIPENQLTDFDRFLLNQAEEKQKRKPVKTHPKHAKKKPLILKCNSTSSIEDCQPSTSKNYSVENNWPSVSKNYGVENDQTSTNHCSELSEEVESIINKRKTKPALKKMKLGTKFAEGIARKKRKISLVKNYLSDDEISDFEDNNDNDESLSDKDYKPDDQAFDSSDDSLKESESDASAKKGKMTKSKNSENKKKSPHNRYKRVVDDGNRGSYIKRLKQYEKTELLKKHQKIMESEDGVVDSDEEFTEFDDFKVPTHVWGKLYRHQQTGVRWLWELHQQNCGGIVGDEMGLGKTIQIIVFLAGLEVTNVRTNGDLFRGRGPVVLVCPTTVMHQWVKEFHTWWPSARVAILHESGSYVGKKPILVAAINQTRGILVTSYSGLVSHQLSLLNYDWHYVILDEGHKIRNPDAQATLIAKQFRTPHRLILSGSPIQNNLKELWSLFDFIFPGKLGTLPVFMQQFSVPIVQGGYANASQVQVQTAFKCASVLRDTIKPYLLRRMKADVKMSIQLPNKNEQVLFCKLSDDQKELYKAYIASSEVQSIISARLQIFVGLINLRKICNHPDLYTGGPKIFKDTNLSTLSEDMHYGFYKRSGKMIVVDSLLRLWHKQGHRVLLFTQSRQMIAILELFVKNRNYTYMKMDGSTAISSRQPAIAKFNSDPSIFIFLLTTRVGGLGVNLTSANRVIIYDPDWNPSTDAQARERSWRIGQERQVTIYRLLTAGTIEEKIYHRQIFKQFVTNRVLKDPRQRRFFKSNDLYELFTFSEMGKEGTETSAIFAGTGSEIKPLNKGTRTNKSKGGFWAPSKPMDIEVSFSSSKVQKMKELAKRLSSQLAQKQPESEKIQNECMSSEKSESDSKMKNSLLPALTQEEKNSPKKGQSPNRNSKSITIKTPNEVTKKKHSKRKWQSTIVEGEKIKFLVKADVYKAAGEETEENSQNDDYVLSRLFKKSGVHTALKHDVIVDASDPDYMLVEGEANRVAQEAIKALKQSRRQCARAVEGIPTWTGTSGNVKRRFGVKKRLPPSSTTSSQKFELSEESNPGPSGIVCKHTFSPAKDNQESTESSSNRLSSAGLLSAIKKRKEMFSITQNGEESDSDHDELISHELPFHTEYDELLVDIRNFIAFGSAVDGQAKTEEIVEKFKDKLPVEHTAVFRSLLTKICTFSRISGDGTWILKEEFR